MNINANLAGDFIWWSQFGRQGRLQKQLSFVMLWRLIAANRNQRSQCPPSPKAGDKSHTRDQKVWIQVLAVPLASSVTLRQLTFFLWSSIWFLNGGGDTSSSYLQQLWLANSADQGWQTFSEKDPKVSISGCVDLQSLLQLLNPGLWL